jgi:hypothetical protein
VVHTAVSGSALHARAILALCSWVTSPGLGLGSSVGSSETRKKEAVDMACKVVVVVPGMTAFVVLWQRDPSDATALLERDPTTVPTFVIGNDLFGTSPTSNLMLWSQACPGVPMGAPASRAPRTLAGRAEPAGIRGGGGGGWGEGGGRDVARGWGGGGGAGGGGATATSWTNTGSNVGRGAVKSGLVTKEVHPKAEEAESVSGRGIKSGNLKVEEAGSDSDDDALTLCHMIGPVSIW